MKQQSKTGPIPDEHFESDAPANPGAVDALPKAARKAFDASVARDKEVVKAARAKRAAAGGATRQPEES